jgi:hypothetical protein
MEETVDEARPALADDAPSSPSHAAVAALSPASAQSNRSSRSHRSHHSVTSPTSPRKVYTAALERANHAGAGTTSPGSTPDDAGDTNGDDDDEEEECPLTLALLRDAVGSDDADDVVGAKAIHLEWRGITSMEGDALDLVHEARDLYLQYNSIRRICGLNALLRLELLALQGNKLRRIEGIAHLLSLKFLDISDNSIAEIRDGDLPPKIRIFKGTGNPFALADGYRPRVLSLLPSCFRVDGVDETSRVGMEDDEEEEEEEEGEGGGGDGDGKRSEISSRSPAKSVSRFVTLPGAQISPTSATSPGTGAGARAGAHSSPSPASPPPRSLDEELAEVRSSVAAENAAAQMEMQESLERYTARRAEALARYRGRLAEEAARSDALAAELTRTTTLELAEARERLADMRASIAERSKVRGKGAGVSSPSSAASPSSLSSSSSARDGLGATAGAGRVAGLSQVPDWRSLATAPDLVDPSSLRPNFAMRPGGGGGSGGGGGGGGGGRRGTETKEGEDEG